MACVTLSAQNSEQTDSLVRLIGAQSIRMIQEENGPNYRMVYGPARFLHNNTYLDCDTAKWDVNSKVIDAWGHVRILQDETVLDSDKLSYYIDFDRAEFRGSLVQLTDKDGNTLRTRHLDYNTKDSVAIFSYGGAMKDKDGQLIESQNGSYDSKVKLFTFQQDVNMFSDSVFIKTSDLAYYADDDRAEFEFGVDAWKDDKMLSADKGRYIRSEELFFFRDKVHLMSDEQEAWADSLSFFRNTNNILLEGNVQMRDTSRNVASMAGRVFYLDSLSEVTMTKDATLVGFTKENEVRDTVYIGADYIRYRSRRFCDIEDFEIALAKKRLEDISVDPVRQYRRKAAQDAADAAAAARAQEDEENAKYKYVAPADEGNSASKTFRVNKKKKKGKKIDAPIEDLQLTMADTAAVAPAVEAAPELADTLAADTSIADTLTVAEPMDTTVADASDTLSVADTVVVLDTSKVGFLLALGNVRMFKNDMQARCDSLLYSDLDSLARLYINPIIWNDGNRQYSSDSVTAVVKDSRIDKVSLASNAFITVQEDSLCFDQIRSSEILAYFDSTSTLNRFDALGGASAVFYLEENGSLATVNVVEAKMFSAYLDSGKLRKMYYFDQPKNNAYPTVQLPSDLKKMKGFSWEPDRRPASREDITSYELRDLQRDEYLARPRYSFVQTNIYFPGYVDGVFREMAARDSIKAERRRLESVQKDSLAIKDSLAVSDSLALADTLALTDALAGRDTLAVADSSMAAKPVEDGSEVKTAEPSKSDIKEQKRKERTDAREAKWAELDARDEAKAAAKAQKKLEKKREQTRRLLARAEKEAAKDQKKLDRYIAHFEKQKAKQTAK